MIDLRLETSIGLHLDNLAFLADLKRFEGETDAHLRDRIRFESNPRNIIPKRPFLTPPEKKGMDTRKFVRAVKCATNSIHSLVEATARTSHNFTSFSAGVHGSTDRP